MAIAIYLGASGLCGACAAYVQARGIPFVAAATDVVVDER